MSKSSTERKTMLVGYARTSTLEQEAGLEAQQRELAALGCERVFTEQTSSVGPRRVLDEALEFVRSGDTFVVTKLDRLARSVPHMWEIVKQLQAKSVALRIVNLGIDTATPTGKLMLNVLGGVAEFEREMMLERQREGIQKAKAEEIKQLAGEGLSMGQIAMRLGIGKGSVHRALAENNLLRLDT